MGRRKHIYIVNLAHAKVERIASLVGCNAKYVTVCHTNLNLLKFAGAWHDAAEKGVFHSMHGLAKAAFRQEATCHLGFWPFCQLGALDNLNWAGQQGTMHCALYLHGASGLECTMRQFPRAGCQRRGLL